jgi:hypothetical protein
VLNLQEMELSDHGDVSVSRSNSDFVGVPEENKQNMESPIKYENIVDVNQTPRKKRVSWWDAE